MANIYFKHISIHNFMSYKDAELDLNRLGNVLVGGINNNPEDNAKSNGCGKSSLFSALSWCLTGETISGAKDVSNIYLTGKTEVSVSFTFDNDEYKITRTKNPSNLFVYINGENKSGKGIRDTSELLHNYIPQLSSSLINSVIILGQGLPQKFSNNTPAGRKEVLEKLSNSDFMILDLKDRLNARQTDLNKVKRELDDSNLKINTELRINLNEINTLTAELQDIEDKTTLLEEQRKIEYDLVALQKNLEECSKQIDDLKLTLNEELKEKDSLTTKYVEGFDSLELVDASVYNDKVVNLNAEIRVLENRIYELESISDICPTCGQKLPNVTKIDTTDLRLELEHKKQLKSDTTEELRQINLQNDKLKSEYEDSFKYRLCASDKVIDAINASIAQQENQLKQYDILKLKYSDMLKDIAYKLSSIDNEKSLKEEKIAKLITRNNILDNELISNSAQLAVIAERLKINSRMQTLIKRDFRGYLLNNIIMFIEERARMYALEVFSSDKLCFKLNNNNIDIMYDDKDYSVLSGGEKQKLDIIIQFALRDMLCTFLDFSSNILVLDEITDSLDSIGVNAIFNLINSKLSDVEVVYIISHHVDELEIPADDEIVIIKGEDKISRIV